MRLITKPFSQNDWIGIISDFQDLNLVQTWEYGEAKVRIGPWKVERSVFKDGDRIVGICQAMVRVLPFVGRGLVWINRGPLWRRLQEEPDASLLTAMLVELRRYWVEERGMYLLIAPPLHRDEAFPALFPPSGFAWVEGANGWASARLDLSLPLKELRGLLHPKWRNCLKKAERLGLVSESGSNDQIFLQVMTYYKKMLEQKGYQSSLTPALIHQWQTFLDQDRKLWGIIGKRGEEGLGAILIARFGNTCEYIIGANNPAGRATNVNYFLLWQAIGLMKELGYRWFDLGGMHPQSTPAGIMHFKSGLAGSPYMLVGELEAYSSNIIVKAIRRYIRRTGR
ncbi:MAG: lipid II:glycine glycyltransferase FemX [Desulfobaccales bacterium]